MALLGVVKSHSVFSLSKEKPYQDLGSSITPKDLSKTDKQRLEDVYPQDAGLVQYNLRYKDGREFEQTIRLKNKSINEINFDFFDLQVDWLFLDWDLDSKGILWADPSKPEKQSDIVDFIRSHDVLKTCFAFYFSKSGVRILFKLGNPLTIKSLDDIDLFKSAYSTFVETLDVSSIGGEIENTRSRANPFALSRVPNYTDNGIAISSLIYYGDDLFETLELVFDLSKVKAKAKVRKTKYIIPNYPVDDILNALYNNPYIAYCRENRVSLIYDDWRAIGTNIYSLLGEENQELAYNIFDQFSKFDPKYNPSAVNKAFPHIITSVEEYGAVTWSQFDFSIETLYKQSTGKDAVEGQFYSLASDVLKTLRVMSKGQCRPNPAPVEQGEGTSTTVENSVESEQEYQKKIMDNIAYVHSLLYKKEKKVKDSTVEVPIKNLTNLLTILTEDLAYKDQIKRNHLGLIDMLGDELIEDEDITLIRERISRVYGIAYSKDDAWDAVRLIASQNEFHPVYDYFMTLQWDGVDRMKSLTEALVGKRANVLDIALVQRFLISAVVRPLEWANFNRNVNWKIDTVLILKGAQGKRKSSFFKALCEDLSWFSDNLPSIKNNAKDASMHMLGKWIVEQAEFEGHVARSSVEMMKAFITRESENFRKPYGRSEINARRPSVLVGTTNSDAFLNDITGDRRYWVLDIPKSHMIDLKFVKANRSQIWAQAIELYSKGHQWWLTDKEQEINDSRNQRFRRTSTVEDAVYEYILTEPKLPSLRDHDKYEGKSAFTLKNLVELGLDKKLVEISSGMATHITHYLSSMGWEKTRAYLYDPSGKRGKRIKLFRKLKNFVSKEDEEERGNEDDTR